jgi:hypothetical protein
MPKVVTICSARSVARCRSLAAPVVMLLKMISSADRPPSRVAICPAAQLHPSRTDLRWAVAGCSPGQPCRASTMEIFSTSPLPGISDPTRHGRLRGRRQFSFSLSLSTRLFFSNPRLPARSPRQSLLGPQPAMLRRAASSAASLTRLARSAPAKPGVRVAIAANRHVPQLYHP